MRACVRVWWGWKVERKLIIFQGEKSITTTYDCDSDKWQQTHRGTRQRNQIKVARGAGKWGREVAGSVRGF